ncbi:MAG: GNAT family N-acetyltransferase [Propionibacteriaceae bacterium]|jgi:predicted GNAT superfamily acetyltransferase|nr:GNAT family N-acetyltransferase [Propionibacteriaceae bacterium]
MIRSDPVDSVDRPGRSDQSAPPDQSAPDRSADLVGSAERAARGAARAAGVSLRLLDQIEQMTAAADLLASLWGQSGSEPMTPELLRALAMTGNYVGGAFQADQLVGVAVAFHSMLDYRELHSHIAGVKTGLISRSIGFALKQHQRAWALARDIRVIEWTFDPLVARNAAFNIGKLGAEVERYLPDFYGRMDDAINVGQPSDRLLVRWWLDHPLVVAAAAGQRRMVDPAQAQAFVAVPPDIEALRRSDPAQAGQWRQRVRATLAPALAAGERVVGFDSQRGYALVPPSRPAPAAGRSERSGLSERCDQPTRSERTAFDH